MAGNAFHKLFEFAQAHVKHAITTSFKEFDIDEPIEGFIEDPRGHMRRQAIQIRQGQQLPAVTALLTAEFDVKTSS